MNINSIKLKVPFHDFWIKTIDGYKMYVCNDNCLVGEKINTQEEIVNLNTNKIVFIYGIYNFDDTIILAFKPSEGKKVILENGLIKIDIDNAELIEFSTNDIDTKLKYDKEFNESIFWVFANYLRKNGVY